MERELLLEIGVEELPASWLPELTSQLGVRLREALNAERLKFHGGVEAYSTPRRLTAVVPELNDRQEDHEETLTGPPVSVAKGADGSPTPAGLGFAKKCGVEFSFLTEAEVPDKKGVYLTYLKKQRGHATVDVLPEVLTRVLRAMPFPKHMHWDAQLEDGKGELTFGRPIRWLLYLYGSRVVPYTIARTVAASSPRVQDVTSGPVTYGHRFLATSGRAGRAIKVRTFDEYKKKLAEQYVFLLRTERRERIVKELDAHGRRLGGRVPLHADPQVEALIEEVPDLVEYPTVVAGNISAEFLALPPEVLATTLVHHQHFFPVVGSNGKLMPAFLAVTNTQPGADRSIATNCERVVAARLRDARFFWDADRKVTLDARLERLETVLFHKQLGSYRQKAERIEALARWIATDVFGLKADDPTVAHAALAARLCKADLTTDMVREFTELQGIMGGIYAREEKLPDGGKMPDAVWKAIYCHYLPTAVEADAPPKPEQLGEARITWACVSLADKLDTLVGLFIAGEKPTGSRDPFGMRRAAHGIIRILLDVELLTGCAARRSFESLISKTASVCDVAPSEPSRRLGVDGALKFLYERLINSLETRGFDKRNVRAVLALRPDGSERFVADTLPNLRDLGQFSASSEFRQLAEAFKRVRNIARELVDESLYDVASAIRPSLREPAELALADEMVARGPLIDAAAAEGRNFKAAYAEAAAFQPAVERFFKEVFVMADEPTLRTARLRLMKRLEQLILQLGDISEIVAPES